MNKLHYNAVNAAYRRCAYPNNKKVREDAVCVEGIFGNHFFYPKELEAERETIVEFLQELPERFFPGEDNSSGHFLHLGCHRDGSVWCGDNATKEMLFLMASGLGLAKFSLPREMWSVCPNSLPYIQITL